jgi:predicted dehydrogenase/threonine dehydrogenase-like Zn-dependent dehydrogenase
LEQLTQLLKDGTMQILEVPYPALSNGQVLVRNHFSLISAGTEGKTVKDARLGYIAKARARKTEVKKVIEAAKTFGLKETYRMVMNKLDSPAALGYCCAGEVIAVADDVKGFVIGDKVACGGNSANHAEIISVPVNLCVKVDESVPMQFASFTTLGAIALQGVRQSDLRLGESCVIIGLGLVGQLTVKLLNAAGIKTIGIDVDEGMVKLASENGCDLTIQRSREDLGNSVSEFTDGYGADSVIITAGTNSTDPIELAGVLCRKKGKVIIVGAVPTGFQRKNYFTKELELRMSCSYGAGRYDAEYEEQGIDYPYAYVRWTENRNMQAFVELLRTNKISIDKLLTHTFDFKDAPKAYQIILDKGETFVGVVLKYDTAKTLKEKIQTSEKVFLNTEPNIGLIGAGSFGQNFLLPALKGNCNLVGVATARPNNSKNIADKNGFNYCTGNTGDLFADKNINTIFIATRHDSHAEYVLKSLRSGKNIFVEKPLCLTLAELEEIKNEYLKSSVRLMVGFNRRFSPAIQKMKLLFDDKMPKAIHYRINAGIVPAEHWVHDPKTGGGRIIGEGCHFIDLCMFLAGSKIKTVSANAMKDASNNQDTVVINLSFDNGSIASISYFSNGNKNLSKESIEVFSSGVVAVCDDFKSLNIFGKNISKLNFKMDKGHQTEVKTFLNSIASGKSAPISFDEIYLSTLATLKVHESISQNGKEVTLDL